MAALLLLGAAPLPATGAEPVEAPLAKFIVGFHALPSLAEGQAFHGGLVTTLNPTLAFAGVATRDAARLARELAGDGNVRYLEPDGKVVALGLGATFLPNDPQWANQYGPGQVRVNRSWDTTLGSTAAKVCILDTGVRRTHQDLAGARYLGGHDYVNGDTDPADDNGHGTQVAGIAVAGVNNGVGIAGMGNTGYYAVKVLDAETSGDWSTVANGITWCANNGGPRTVHMLALGGSSYSQAVQDAVALARNVSGHLLVAPAGAGGCEDCVLYPARYAEVMAISCNTAAETLCGFSSTGPEVELSAPGTTLRTTCSTSDSAYCDVTGTSFSAAHVAGIAALYWSFAPATTQALLRTRLQDTSVDRGAAGFDNHFGHGRVDAKCLFDGNTSCTSEAPPPPPPPACPGPANNCFANATAIGAFPFSTLQSTAGATTETGEPLPCGSMGSTVWFRFTAPASGRVAVTANSSSYDTVLAAYTGSALNALTNRACNDDTYGLQAYIEFNVLAGTTYQVQAGGYQGASGTLRLAATYVSGGPPLGCTGNDQRANACVIPSPPYANRQSTVGFGVSVGDPACGDLGASAWYSYEFIAPPKVLHIDTLGSDYDTMLGVYISMAGQLLQVACDDDSAGNGQAQVDLVQLPVLRYYIQAGGAGGASGTLQLNVDEPLP